MQNSSSVSPSNTRISVGRTISMSGTSSSLCGRARELFDQADRLVAEIADQAGERGRQRLGHVDPARGGERAQFGEAVALRAPRTPRGRASSARLTSQLRAGRAEDEVGIEPEQAVAPADRAAFDRFEQEIAASRARSA